MNIIVFSAIAIISLAVIEQLVAWLMERLFPNGSKKHPLALVIAIIILVISTVFLQNYIEFTPPSTANGMLYQLAVQDAETRELIEGAEVILLVPGVPAFRDTTDNEGLAVFEDLPESVIGKSATLSIQATGYEMYRLNVAVSLNQLPDLIAIDRE